MAAGEDVVTAIVTELRKLVSPLVLAGVDEEIRNSLFDAIGWELAQLQGFPVGTLTSRSASIATTASTLTKSAATGPESLNDVEALLDGMRSLFDDIRALSTLAQDPALQVSAPVRAALEGLGRALSEFLIVEYLRKYHPAALHAARLLTLIETPGDRLVPAQTSSGETGLPLAPPRVRLDRLGALLSDPVQALSQEYVGPDGLATVEDARDAASKLFGRVAPFMASLGAIVTDGSETAGAISRDGTRSLAVRFPIPVDGAFAAVGAVLEILSDAEGGAGVAITPTGWAGMTWPSRDWTLTLAVSGQVAKVTLRRVGAPTLSGAPAIALTADLQRQSDGDATSILAGSRNGTRLEVGTLRASFTLDATLQAQDFGLLFEFSKAALVVSAGDGDGFLQHVLPPDGLRVEFDLALGWSKSRGLYFGGAAGFEATIPVDLSIFGVLTLDSVYLALRAEAAAKATDAGAEAAASVRAVAGVTTTLQLGPVTANVERFGIQALLDFPPGGGNLGIADFQMQFKPPSGAGLVVDAAAVSGGGYLFFDPEKEQYAGVLQLEFASKVSLKVIGLLTTRMPDGKPGFSLVLIVAAEFAPIQLGFGFNLSGVGGLLGINRAVIIEALRSGIKQGTLDSVLFPPNPVENAPQIISTLNTVFPPHEGRFFVGPMAKIGWGTPVLLTVDIALVIELPSPVRLLLLGRLKLVLPQEKDAVIYLRLDVLGVIDFERGELSLDATLYDSRIAQFVVTGDMALRVSWGAQPSFILAVGGFNPRFPAPAGFPKLDRVAISLAAGDNPRLRLEAYLAVTSNTVQFGARLELFVAAGIFTLDGFFAFDALIVMSPFSLLAELGGLIALRQGGKLLMSIQLEMTLTGPTPWQVRGKATFSILGFSQSVAFDARIGNEAPPPPLTPVPVMDDLVKALADPRNWTSELPRGEHPLVSFRDAKLAEARLVHPLATLTVRQRVVPLDVPISRYGSTRPSDGNRFSISVVGPDGAAAPLDAVPLTDAFAPAQFQEMSDADKLTKPSFVQMTSGYSFGDDETVFDFGAREDVNIGYETHTILTMDDTPVIAGKVHALTPAVLDSASLSGPAGRAAIWRSGSERYRSETLVPA